MQHQKKAAHNASRKTVQLRGTKTQVLNSNSVSGLQDGVLPMSAQEFVPQNRITFISHHDNKSKFLLLSTAICYLSDENGKEFELKWVLDSGRVSSFLSRNSVHLMQLKKRIINIPE